MLYREINAIVPYYNQYGQNQCQILMKNGQVEYQDNSVKRFLIQMYYDYHLDPKAVGYWIQANLGSKLNNPKVVDSELIFFPVKTRQAISRHDGNFAYINWKYVVNKTRGKISFENGMALEVMATNEYIQRKINESRLLSYVYHEYKKDTWLVW